MLFISYGLQKSASTFCWQLTVDVAQSAGSDQCGLRDKLLPPSLRNSYVILSDLSVRDLVEAVPDDQTLVLKTHSPMSDKVRELLDQGLIRASATFRDPRDAAVAVLDVAPKDRKRNENRVFGNVRTMVQAIDLIAGNLRAAESWLSDERVLRMPFDLLSKCPQMAVRRIAAHMGVVVDAVSIVEPYLTGGKEIIEFNRGVAGRYCERMTQSDLAYAHQQFGSYIERFDQLTASHG